MGEPLSLMYGIDLQTRCLAGIPAEQEKTLFLVGTLSLKQDNQLCLLEVDEDWLQISKRSFAHPSGEIWHLASSPISADIAATCHSLWNKKLETGATIWKIDGDSVTLIEQAKFSPGQGTKRCTAFEFHPDGHKAAISADKTLYLADIEESLKISNMKVIDSKGNINAISWNPHVNGNTISLAFDNCIQTIDVRSKNEAFKIENAHNPVVRNMDYNPNVQYTLATCGDDCRVSIWDSRKTSEPLLILMDHSHWVWSVKFNPIHDQLLLSVGSDARLFLNSIASLSLEYREYADIPEVEMVHPRLGDERLEKLEEHEDSVYACAWAGNDPWVFASLSFDGRLIISRVKRHHKYAILYRDNTTMNRAKIS